MNAQFIIATVLQLFFPFINILFDAFAFKWASYGRFDDEKYPRESEYQQQKTF